MLLGCVSWMASVLSEEESQPVGTRESGSHPDKGAQWDEIGCLSVCLWKKTFKQSHSIMMIMLIINVTHSGSGLSCLFI